MTIQEQNDLLLYGRFLFSFLPCRDSGFPFPPGTVTTAMIGAAIRGRTCLFAQIEAFFFEQSDLQLVQL